MVDPRDALRTTRALGSVPGRLERVEQALRELQDVKDHHARTVAPIPDALVRLASMERRVAELERRIERGSVATRRREALSATTASPDLDVADPDDPRDAAVRATRLASHEVLTLLRPSDRLGPAWPAAAIAALGRRPDAVAAYGERIGVLDDGIDAVDATLLVSFEPDPGHPDARLAVDAGTLVVRAAVLARHAFGPGATAADLRRAVFDAGPVVAVPVLATVGVHRDPTA